MPVLVRDRYCTIKEYRDIYKLSDTHVRNLIKQGMPHKRVGNAIRINFDKAEEWIKQFN